jgi:hypothetical protein
MKKIFLWIGLWSAVNAVAQKQALNQLVFNDTCCYAFFVSGHFHGSSQNISGYPAATLLANLDMINTSGALALCSTGDLFLDVRNNIPQYRQALFSKLKIPLYNAVGNHDISGKVYQENFGNTWFGFTAGSALFVFLDTEAGDGSISGDQLDWFTSALSDYCSGGKVKNVFVFSHRPVWSESDGRLKNVFKENTRSDFGNNFESKVLPLLKKYTAKIPFYWFSGSLGANAPASFFYFRADKNLFYIQSAIRDLPRDGLLKVKVDRDKVSFETVSLTAQPVPKLEDCGLQMWKNTSGEPGFNYRLVPLYIKQMIFHRYFWYGFAYCLVACLIFYFIRKRIKRKKIA